MSLTKTFVIVLAWFSGWVTLGALVAGPKGALAAFFVGYITGFGLPWLVPDKWTDE